MGRTPDYTVRKSLKTNACGKFGIRRAPRAKALPATNGFLNGRLSTVESAPYQRKWFDTQASHPKKDLKSRHLGQANSMPFDTLQSSASLTLRKVEKFVLLRLTLSCLWASEAILVEIVAQNRLSAQTQGFYKES
jgi:hypothetical protein